MAEYAGPDFGCQNFFTNKFEEILIGVFNLKNFQNLAAKLLKNLGFHLRRNRSVLLKLHRKARSALGE